LPVPCLEIVSKFAQITLEAARKFVILRRNLIGAQARFQRAVSDTCGKSRSRRRRTCLSVRKSGVDSSWRNVIRHREWIERILDRDTEASGTDPKRATRVCPDIRRKWNRG